MKWIESNVVPIIKKKYGLKVIPDTMIYADTYEYRADRFDRLQKSQGHGDPWLSGWIELEDLRGNIADFTWRKKNGKLIVEKEPGWALDVW